MIKIVIFMAPFIGGYFFLKFSCIDLNLQALLEDDAEQEW